MTFSSNYFQLFGLPECFNIDLLQLSKNYRSIQRRTHPDRFANASRHEQLLSARYAADVNDAYQTLREPVKRAAYLLTLRGVLWGEEQSRLVDPEFLMQQIRLREELGEIRGAPDPESELDQMNMELASLMEELAGQFIVQLKNAGVDAEQRAVETVNKMQFIAKIQHEAQMLEEELLDY